MRGPLRSLIVLGVLTAFMALPAALPEVAPSLPALPWLGTAAAECAVVDPETGEVVVDPPECAP